jgi:hypothetical protein
MAASLLGLVFSSHARLPRSIERRRDHREHLPVEMTVGNIGLKPFGKNTAFVNESMSAGKSR